MDGVRVQLLAESQMKRDLSGQAWSWAWAGLRSMSGRERWRRGNRATGPCSKDRAVAHSSAGQCLDASQCI